MAQTVDEPAAAGEVDQVRVDRRERLRRGRLVTAVVAGALVLVLVVVGLLGGFGKRTYPFDPVRAGTVITTGPYEVTVTGATAEWQRIGEVWQVVVSGTARTTGDVSIRPMSGDSGFLWARSESTRESQPSQYHSFGPDQTLNLDYLTPGLAPTPWRTQFEFTQPPGDRLRVVVFDLEYVKPYIFGDELGWRPGDGGKTVELPVEVLTR